MTLHSTLQSMPLEQRSALLLTLETERAQRQRTNRLKGYKPYAKQREFHDRGALFRERLFMAGNQLGKTMAGAAETAMHLTGEYSPDWTGLRFPGPIIAIAGSESGELTRDGVQRLLVGPPDREEEWGTGFIPQRAISDRTRRTGVSDALDTVTVKHVSGGHSTVYFKSYDQGRSKWQANTVHFVWFDEEPPEDVYMEGITRTNATKGSVIMTFTPLMGMSAVVERFQMQESDDRTTVTMTIDDAEHYSPEERRRIIESYPAHEREARTKGIPSLGSGLIFPVLEEEIVIDPISIPPIWPQIIGVDFGYDHPFGACRLAWDRDADTIYVTANYRSRQTTPVFHAAAVKPWGDWIPVAWPHDGLQHDKGSGDQLAKLYGDQGLNMMVERATFDDGGFGVEAGIAEMLDRMLTGRWKVFNTCAEWLQERRLYHRKDGKIVKERDDVLSASRYAMMMLRFAEVHKPASSVQPSYDWVA
jgi:phage terminase large subunit-like protein